ncbi:MAG: type 1 glutamine amidotransferase domain-containing protein [Cytophagales bacterium]
MKLTGKKILSFVHDEFEDLELWYPIYRCREEGATVLLAGKKAAHKYIGKYGVPAVSDMSWDDVVPDDFDGLLVPGGWAPDKIRRFSKVIEIVQNIHRRNKPIGQICHAGWVLISAKILNGYTVTSTPGIKDDMENAGGIWVDEPVVFDRNIVSAQRPADLPAYMRLFIERF